MLNPLAILLAVAAFLFTSAHAAERKPSIVLILADDLGGRDAGCHGNTLHQTPHIDAMARRGMDGRTAYSLL